MRNALLKWLCSTPFGIHMVRKKIAGMAGMHYKVGFSNSAPQGDTLIANAVIFKKSGFKVHV